MNATAITLLGRRDEPTDAVEEYCRYLGVALQVHNIDLQLERADWLASGWSAALQNLSTRASSWAPSWVIVQYTALAWSKRGFPRRFLSVIETLRRARVRTAVVFHDVEPFAGAGLLDRLRRRVQIHTMRRAMALAHRVIFTVPPEKISWLSAVPRNSTFIPVGPNLPIPVALEAPNPGDAPLTVGVFSITGGEAGIRETRDIVAAVRHASQKLGQLRLSVFGRHAELREAALREGLRDLPVELMVDGVLDNGRVVAKLRACDVVLFVRGGISTRRSSAIAAIACGVPLVAYSGSETSAPITEAGVILVSPGHPEELQSALVRVLSDSGLRTTLAAASRAAYQNHFAWPAIAARFAATLNMPRDPM